MWRRKKPGKMVEGQLEKERILVYRQPISDLDRGLTIPELTLVRCRLIPSPIHRNMCQRSLNKVDDSGNISATSLRRKKGGPWEYPSQR